MRGKLYLLSLGISRLVSTTLSLVIGDAVSELSVVSLTSFQSIIRMCISDRYEVVASYIDGWPSENGVWKDRVKDGVGKIGYICLERLGYPTKQ